MYVLHLTCSVNKLCVTGIIIIILEQDVFL